MGMRNMISRSLHNNKRHQNLNLHQLLSLKKPRKKLQLQAPTIHPTKTNQKLKNFTRMSLTACIPVKEYLLGICTAGSSLTT